MYIWTLLMVHKANLNHYFPQVISQEVNSINKLRPNIYHKEFNFPLSYYYKVKMSQTRLISKFMQQCVKNKTTLDNLRNEQRSIKTGFPNSEQNIFHTSLQHEIFNLTKIIWSNPYRTNHQIKPDHTHNFIKSQE